MSKLVRRTGVSTLYKAKTLKPLGIRQQKVDVPGKIGLEQEETREARVNKRRKVEDILLAIRELYNRKNVPMNGNTRQL